MTFKVGDKVRCVSASGCPFDQGQILTVAEANDDFLGFAEESDTSAGWRASRFELVPPTASSLDLLAAMTGHPLKFRSGCTVQFVAFVKAAKPHCQLVLLNPATGNVVTRYANGKGSEEPYDEPGDILLA